MKPIALEGLAEVGTEEIFQSSAWWRPFGMEADDVLKTVPRLVEIAGVAFTAAHSNKTYKPFELSAQEPRCFLLTAPRFRKHRARRTVSRC